MPELYLHTPKDALFHVAPSVPHHCRCALPAQPSLCVVTLRRAQPSMQPRAPSSASCIAYQVWMSAGANLQALLWDEGAASKRERTRRPSALLCHAWAMHEQQA